MATSFSKPCLRRAAPPQTVAMPPSPIGRQLVPVELRARGERALSLIRRHSRRMVLFHRHFQFGMLVPCRTVSAPSGGRSRDRHASRANRNSDPEKCPLFCGGEPSWGVLAARRLELPPSHSLATDEVGDDALLDGGRPDGGLTRRSSDARALDGRHDRAVGWERDRRARMPPGCRPMPGWMRRRAVPTCGRKFVRAEQRDVHGGRMRRRRSGTTREWTRLHRRIAGRCDAEELPSRRSSWRIELRLRGRFPRSEP